MLVDHLHKIKKEYKNLKKQEIQDIFIKTNYGDFKDLTRRTAANKALHDKSFNIAKNPKYDGYQRGLASMVNKFLDKKTSGGAAKFERRKVHSSFTDNIWVLILQICN